MANRDPLNPLLSEQDMKTITSVPSQPPPQKRKSNLKTQKPIPPEFLQPVSITVSESQPLKAVFIELAKQAGVDLQLAPHISSHFVFSAKSQPFINVVEDMCELGGLRYKIINKAVRIEVDTPYVENYNVQFLNLARSSQNRISIATDVFSNMGSNTNQNKTPIDNGSNSSVNVASTSDFWLELENNLKIILGHTNTNHTAASPPPAPSLGPTFLSPSLLQPSTSSTTASNYSLHKQAGIVSVFGTAKHHKAVESYLKHLRAAASSQVLIEAKIVEVNLKEEFKSGINWQKIGTHGDWQFNAKFGDLSQNSRFHDPTSPTTNLVSMGATGTNFSSILQALQEFGASRTLSSPRLTVMNNQTAILKVAQNQVYFRINYDKQFSTTIQQQSVNISSDIQTVSIGLVMSVQPSIDPETGEIILFLRPTISRLNQAVRDPAVDIAYNANISAGTSASELIKPHPSLVPVVEVREIDSVLRLKDGEIAILGGLMEIRSTQDNAKLPFLGDVALVKELFNSYSEGDLVVELVILLKASILEDAAGPDNADQRLLQSYIRDPRPL
ncbi:MAG: secretin N-terminal domain-containing protein [Alphaproteobacteria bacterium]|nr:secretin N-terminal domain-containing protein [Alphaproteobacteria bacterium]